MRKDRFNFRSFFLYSFPSPKVQIIKITGQLFYKFRVRVKINKRIQE